LAAFAKSKLRCAFNKDLIFGCQSEIAAIGNIVPQLHVHIVARRKDDRLWPKPVWGATVQRACEPAALARFVAAIRRRLHLPIG
jgi:diadenosine tetraphosphate (Ap4A) HIT family hydrolase